MAQYNDAVLELLLDTYGLIEQTQEEALLKGAFSNLTKAEMNTLNRIGPYTECSMGETAAKLGITTGTLTVSIKRLTKKGYVKRRKDDKDRRLVLLSLTRKGKLAYRMYRKFHRLLVEGVLAEMDDVSETVFLRMLETVYGYLAEQHRYLQEKEGHVLHEDDL